MLAAFRAASLAAPAANALHTAHTSASVSSISLPPLPFLPLSSASISTLPDAPSAPSSKRSLPRKETLAASPPLCASTARGNGAGLLPFAIFVPSTSPAMLGRDASRSSPLDAKGDAPSCCRSWATKLEMVQGQKVRVRRAVPKALGRLSDLACASFFMSLCTSDPPAPPSAACWARNCRMGFCRVPLGWSPAAAPPAKEPWLWANNSGAFTAPAGPTGDVEELRCLGEEAALKSSCGSSLGPVRAYTSTLVTDLRKRRA
mmetsp:Transcript_21255/g.55387  ORF Transcript_21255/g.55387 Transcript_21255/m.55387 type:complete len:260 (-) Transcript_21255:2029-2808(-)